MFLCRSHCQSWCHRTPNWSLCCAQPLTLTPNKDKLLSSGCNSSGLLSGWLLCVLSRHWWSIWKAWAVTSHDFALRHINYRQGQTYQSPGCNSLHYSDWLLCFRLRSSCILRHWSLWAVDLCAFSMDRSPNRPNESGVSHGESVETS